MILIFALAVFYVIPGMENQGDSSFEFVNTVGLIVVVAGVIAAGLIFRRATPHK